LDRSHSQDLPPGSNRIDLDFLGIFKKFGNNDWMLWGNIRCLVQKKLTLPCISRHTHGCTAENVRWPEQDGITGFLRKCHRIVERKRFAPGGLIDSNAIQ